MTTLHDLRVGQQIILNIAGEGDYSGTVASIKRDKTRVSLTDVNISQSQKKISGTKQFYLPEIRSIKVVSDVQNDTPEKESKLSYEAEVDEQLKFRIADRHKGILRKLVQSQKTIATVGEEFQEALDDILQHDCVGLCAENVQNGEITIIVCTTPRQIYGFDVKQMGTIDRLKELLESETLTKVVDNSKLLKECLLCRHGIELKGIFDTMAVSKLIGFTSDISTLVEEINKEEVSEQKIDTPITVTAVLLRFHNFLTEVLLKNAYQSFDDNLNFLRREDDLQAYLLQRNESSTAERLNKIRPFKFLF